MMGPLFIYDDEQHWNRLLSASCAANINVQLDPIRPSVFCFRRGRALVYGFRDFSALGEVYLGCGHPTNPLRWSGDMSLLSEIEQIFSKSGARPFSIAAIE